MEESEFRDQVLRRMDVLIRLLLDRPEVDAPGLSAQAQRLKGFGLSTGEIAGILGKPSNYISAVLPKESRKKKLGA